MNGDDLEERKDDLTSAIGHLWAVSGEIRDALKEIRDRLPPAAPEWAKFFASQCEPAADRPKIVCLCGSTRFMGAFQAANFRETLAGKIVLSVGCNTKSDAALELAEEDKERLDALHFRKIEIADEVLVLNVGGYVGYSTGREIEHAEKLGKPIRYLEDAALARPAGEGA